MGNKILKGRYKMERGLKEVNFSKLARTIVKYLKINKRHECTETVEIMNDMYSIKYSNSSFLKYKKKDIINVYATEDKERYFIDFTLVNCKPFLKDSYFFFLLNELLQYFAGKDALYSHGTLKLGNYIIENPSAILFHSGSKRVDVMVYENNKPMYYVFENDKYIEEWEGEKC